MCYSSIAHLHHNPESRKLLTGERGNNLSGLESYSQLVSIYWMTFRMLPLFSIGDTVFWEC